MVTEDTTIGPTKSHWWHLLSSLLTGLYPFYQHVDLTAHEIQAKIVDNKETPYVDPRYRTRSAIEAGLVKIMEQCWIWDPDKRIEIYEAVRQLRVLKANRASETLG